MSVKTAEFGALPDGGHADRRSVTLWLGNSIYGPRFRIYI